MSNNVETCNCARCREWRTVVLNICNMKNLDYNKLSVEDKVDLYHWYMHTDKQCLEHNWNIIKKKFNYAMVI